MIKIIFVCHGNICRSPAAECVFNQLVKANGLSQEFECYSRALTTEEIGNDIYPPMKQALIKKNIEFKHHEATLLDDLDIQWADYIVYMDDENKYCIDNYYQIEPNKLINLAKFIKKVRFQTLDIIAGLNLL